MIRGLTQRKHIIAINKFIDKIKKNYYDAIIFTVHIDNF